MASSLRAWAVRLAGAVALGTGLPTLAALAANPAFTLSADGAEVFDARTGLIWRRCAEGMEVKAGRCTGRETLFSHDRASDAASARALSTGTSWRLPTAAELRGIAATLDPHYTPIDAAAFPNSPPGALWTAENAGGTHWVAVDLYTGQSHTRSGDRDHPIRLVRSADGN